MNQYKYQDSNNNNMPYGKTDDYGSKKAVSKEPVNYQPYNQNYDGMLFSCYKINLIFVN